MLWNFLEMSPSNKVCVGKECRLAFIYIYTRYGKSSVSFQERCSVPRRSTKFRLYNLTATRVKLQSFPSHHIKFQARYTLSSVAAETEREDEEKLYTRPKGRNTLRTIPLAINRLSLSETWFETFNDYFWREPRITHSSIFEVLYQLKQWRERTVVTVMPCKVKIERNFVFEAIVNWRSKKRKRMRAFLSVNSWTLPLHF